MKTFKTGIAAVVMMMAATACGPTGQQECPAVACTLACENGFQQGEDGCDICACEGGNNTSSGGSSGSTSGGSSGMTSSSSGGIVCPQLECPEWAPCYGPVATDEQGCPTCGCAPQACADISDEATCNNTPGCVAVIFAADGQSNDEPTSPPPRAVQCCVDGPNGVDCGGTEPSCFGAWLDQAGQCRGPADGSLPAECCGNPNNVCYDDNECAPGLRCELRDCPPCLDEPNAVCDVVCLGQCVPAEPVQACWSSDDCSAGFTCDLVNYCESACGPGDEACPAVCLGRCVPTEDPCAVVRCGNGDQCVACGPNEDCTAKCVPQVPHACLAILCAPDTQCVACEANEDCVAKCVAVEPQDCRSSLWCGEGAECVPVTECNGGAACLCNINDPSCTCPPPDEPTCNTQWVCQPVTPQDPCTVLTEEECQYDHDQCSPQYATACPACAPGQTDCNRECFTSYAGCFSVN